MEASRRHTWYTRFTKASSRIAGRPVTFAIMTGLVIVWAVSGPYFGYSDTWQLTINTGTTVITFLMVFVIQATQNRDAEAIQIKLDEVIRALEGAHNAMLDLEELEEDELLRMRDRYLRIAEQARKALSKGRTDTGVAEFIEAAKEAEREAKDRKAAS